MNFISLIYSFSLFSSRTILQAAPIINYEFTKVSGLGIFFLYAVFLIITSTLAQTADYLYDENNNVYK